MSTDDFAWDAVLSCLFLDISECLELLLFFLLEDYNRSCLNLVLYHSLYPYSTWERILGNTPLVWRVVG